MRERDDRFGAFQFARVASRERTNCNAEYRTVLLRLRLPRCSSDHDEQHSDARPQEGEAGQAKDEVASTFHPCHQCESDEEVERYPEQCR